MSPFQRQCTAALTALAVCSTAGLHWLLLQTVAWAGMLVLYAQDRPLDEAVADTLDGAHPCELCRAIAAGKKDEAERRSSALPGTLAKKLILALAPALAVVAPAPQLVPFVASSERALACADAPPVPPPRGA